MSIVRVQKRENPWVQIDKRTLDDERLSWKAKGILSYLLTRPDDWTVRPSQLQTVSTDGRHATYSALEELHEADYIEKRQKRDENGHFDGYEYVVYERPRDAENPDTGNPNTGNPNTGNPNTDSPDTENPSPTNNDSTNKEGTNKSGSGRRARPRVGSGDSVSSPDVDVSAPNPFQPEPPPWLPEKDRRFADTMAQMYEQFDAKPDHLKHLARQQWWSGGERPDIHKDTLVHHVKEYPWAKVVAAYVLARRAQGPPQDYAHAVLQRDFNRPTRDDDQADTDPKQRPAENHARIAAAVDATSGG